MSFVQPASGSSARRRKYEEWRGAGTRVNNGIAIGGGTGLAFHPAMEPLEELLGRGELSFVPGIGGAQFNRSHFEQQDLVETGAGSTGSPRPDGFLGRALDLMPQSTEALSSIALNEIAPLSMKMRGRSPLSIPDFVSFGQLSSRTYRANANRPLRERLQQLYVANTTNCAQGSICEIGETAVAGLDDLAALRAQTTPFPAEQFAGLANLVRADSSNQLKFVTLDVGGWDTHNQQGGDARSGNSFSGSFAQRLQALAGRLRGLYDAANEEGVWNRFTVMVMSEFGRTTRENGTTGTDHGFGGIGMVLGSGLRAPVLGDRYFPATASASFYSDAESVNVVPRLHDYRYVVSQILRDRFGLTTAQLETTVFPGLDLGASVPRLFS